MRFFLSFIMALTGLSAIAQDYEAPLLHCFEQDSLGFATLSWQPVISNIADFMEYRIFNDGGNPAVVINDVTQTTRVLNNIANGPAPQSFWMAAVYSSGGQEFVIPSDTISTFSVDDFSINVTLQTTIGQEQWDFSINDSFLPSPADSLYETIGLEVRYDGSWINVFSAPYSQASISYVPEICGSPPGELTVEFRVTFTDLFGCQSNTILKKRPFTDSSAPTPPEIETVTVDTTRVINTTYQKPVVCWFPSASGDVAFYDIIRVLPNGTQNPTQVNSIADIPASVNEIIVDDIYDQDLDWAVDNGVRLFRVLARDSCGAGNQSTFDNSVSGGTIWSRATFDQCAQSAIVEWTEYEWWTAGVQAYVIYGGILNAPMQPLDTLAATTTTYFDDAVPLNTDYSYLIKALPVDSIKPSLSNKINVRSTYVDTPAETYLANVSVTPNSRAIEVSAYVDTLFPTPHSFIFEKLDRFGEDFDPIIQLPSAAHQEGYITITDLEARPSSGVEQYRLVSIDSCGNPVDTSLVGRPMRLSVDYDSDERVNRLSWTRYREWAGDIASYEIWRRIGSAAFDSLTTIGPSMRQYIDSVGSEDDYLNQGDYCYYVIAHEGPAVYGVSQESRSNTLCGQQESSIFIPNAFTPNGDLLNDTFNPLAGYIERVEDYELAIYDRWGRETYTSNDITTGWDGRDGVGFIQEGLYLYRLTYRSGSGQIEQLTGHVTVLFPDDGQ